jgi:hypothetical protein
MKVRSPFELRLSWDLEADFFADGLGHAFQDAVVFQEDALNAIESLSGKPLPFGHLSIQLRFLAIRFAQLSHKARLILDQGS